MFITSPRTRNVALGLLCLCSGGPGLGAEAGDADITEMKRAIAELRAQNRALAQRVELLEAEKTGRSAAAGGVSQPAAAATTAASAAADLTRRVSELELAKIAQQDATRAIIKDSLAKVGSKVNEAVSLGGAVEMLASRSRDFEGARKSALKLNTGELEFDVQAGDWASAKLKLEYVDGSNSLANSSRGFETPVDRIALHTASLTLGDLQRFPLVLQAGRMNLPFGSSTGVHRSDTLAIEGPLTTDAFQMTRTAIGVGFGWPTPKPVRPALPVVAPTVKPLVLAPLLSAFARQLGYLPPPSRPKPPAAVSAPAEPPPYYGSLMFYEGGRTGAQRGFVRNLNARLGYRSSGHCGQPYSALRAGDFCPWSLDINLDYNNAIFNSDFLQTEYQAFLRQFGPVRGMAATAKLALGPLMLAGEWSSALAPAAFVDDFGTPHRIKPGAWQASLGYQFDWNPWAEAIGGQGSYLALGYSQSRDLAGALQLVNGERTRVGALPRSRWTLTAGEWVAEGLKVQIEYSHIKDYAISEAGSGASGHGIQLTLTYAW